VYSEELPVTYIGTPNFIPTVQASARFPHMWRVTSDESPASSAAATILGSPQFGITTPKAAGVTPGTAVPRFNDITEGNDGAYKAAPAGMPVRARARRTIPHCSPASALNHSPGTGASPLGL